MALQHALLFLAQAVGAQSALFVVLVFTEQGALLAVLLAPAWRVLVSGQRLAVEVDGVGGATLVEGGFALDQTVGVVAEVVVLTPFVLDLGEQQARVVVAVTAWSPRILLGRK